MRWMILVFATMLLLGAGPTTRPASTRPVVVKHSLEQIFTGLPRNLRPRLGEEPTQIQWERIDGWVEKNIVGFRLDTRLKVSQIVHDKEKGVVRLSLQTPNWNSIDGTTTIVQSADIRWLCDGVEAEFPSKYLDRASKLKEGDSVTIAGIIEAVEIHGARFKLTLPNCTLK